MKGKECENENVDDVTHRFLDAGTSTTADAPLDDLISWIRHPDG